MEVKVLIHSIAKDKTTNDVLDWLYLCDCEIIRIETFYIFTPSLLLIPNMPNKNPIRKSYWYRRGVYGYALQNNILSENIIKDYNKDLIHYSHCSINSIFDKTINKPIDNEINKLKVLINANSALIKIPNTFITDSLKNLQINALKKYILKSNIKPNIKFIYKTKLIQLYSSSIFIDINKISELYKFPFLLSLFQEYIEKKYEIRTFYLKGQFKSMAIFSQQNEKTKIDFRNYDNERPNRCVPYNLPKSLEKKLHQLMLKLDINCGSMDIIVTPNDEYYFLEVNPIGQFQWLSKNCNYFIERMIAEDLAS